MEDHSTTTPIDIPFHSVEPESKDPPLSFPFPRYPESSPTIERANLHSSSPLSEPNTSRSEDVSISTADTSSADCSYLSDQIQALTLSNSAPALLFPSAFIDPLPLVPSSSPMHRQTHPSPLNTRRSNPLPFPLQRQASSAPCSFAKKNPIVRSYALVQACTSAGPMLTGRVRTVSGELGPKKADLLKQLTKPYHKEAITRAHKPHVKHKKIEELKERERVEKMEVEKRLDLNGMRNRLSELEGMVSRIRLYDAETRRLTPHHLVLPPLPTPPPEPRVSSPPYSSASRWHPSIAGLRHPVGVEPGSFEEAMMLDMEWLETLSDGDE